MFTPQRRRLPVAATTPGRSPNFDKGKAPAVSPPPPLSPADGEMEDWRRFREAGLLDKAAMERRDREALLARASRLEKELYEYQHTMGLLLLEKEEWNSKYERINEGLVEASEMLNRERSKNVNALSDAEERVESLSKALTSERQLVHDLEREWRDLREELGPVKRASDARLSDAKSLVTGIEKKSLDVEENLRSAEAKLVEVNLKSLELDVKLRELEARESSLKKERLYLQTEQEAHKAVLFPHRQELNELERSLRAKEKIQSELQKNYIERAEAADETDCHLDQKARDLDDTQRNIDLLFCKLKEREANVDNQLTDLILKEKNVDSKEKTLNAKQDELLAWEEKVNVRGQVGVQKLLDEQIVILEGKKQELELEMEETRKKLEEEAKRKADSLKRVEAESFLREEKLRQQEQALHKRSESIEEEEQDLDAKLKYLNDIDNSIKANQEELDLKRLQLLADQESLLVIGSENEKIRTEISGQQMQISADEEELKLINAERLEWNRMQSDMKQKLARCRSQGEFLLSKAEDLEEERKTFRKEWEVIEEKRAQISKELEEVARQRADLEKMQKALDHRLEEEKHAQDSLKRELEALEVEKGLFEARMGQEKAELYKRAKCEEEQLVKEFESQKENLKSSMIHRHEVMEKELKEREGAFVKKQIDITQITSLKQTCQWELDEIQSEKSAVEMKRIEVVKDWEKLDEQRASMQEDIAELDQLRKKLQGQQEQGLKDRNCFLAYVEKLKSCSNCGDVTRKFLFSDLLPLDVEDIKDFSLTRSMNLLGNRQSDTDAYHGTSSMRLPEEVQIDSVSEKHKSSLRTCSSKILSTSPIKLPSSPMLVNINGDDGGPSNVHVSPEAKESGVPGDKRPPLHGDVHNVIDLQPLQSDSFDLRGGEYSVSLDDHSYVNSGLHIPDDSVQSKPKGLGKRGRRRKGGLGRTHSVKAVVEDAKLLLGENLEECEHTESVQLSDIHDKSQGSQHVERSAGKAPGKRGRVPADDEQDVGDSQGEAESVTTGERRKRQQILSSEAPSPGQQRYNLRRVKKSYVEYG